MFSAGELELTGSGGVGCSPPRVEAGGASAGFPFNRCASREDWVFLLTLGFFLGRESAIGVVGAVVFSGRVGGSLMREAGAVFGVLGSLGDMRANRLLDFFGAGSIAVGETVATEAAIRGCVSFF